LSTQSTAPSPLCIYCNGQGPFSDEHVISAGLGADDSRFMLVDMVCRRCNTDILGKLELEVLRSSPIAIARAFMQSQGRDRGRHTTVPSIQAHRKQMIDSEGYLNEVDFGVHAKPIVLPQIKMIGDKEFLSSAVGHDELRCFVTSLSTMLQDNQITCIRKRGAEHELRYEAITMLRSDNVFARVNTSSFQAKPPRAGLWLQSYDETDTKDAVPTATIFRNLNGSIVLKTSSATIEDALNFFARAVEQFSFDALVTRDIECPIVSVSMSVTIGVMERMTAKIGINLLAYYLGRNYVTDPCFQHIKDGILTGSPLVNSHVVEDAEMKMMLDAAPYNHHVFLLMQVRQPTKRTAILMVAKLYGAAQAIPLAWDVPEPRLPLPVFFLVDYLNHEVKQRTLAEYSQYLTDAPITKTQTR
jgi:hypothetical protein